jgi:uncharacterized protein
MSGDSLRPVPLPELQRCEQGRRWEVNRHLAELASLTPVRGHLQAVHRGTVLEVEGEGATIVTLCCHRCLQHYNHALSARAHELIWLGQGLPPGAEGGAAEALDLEAGALTDCLDPRGSFDPEHWLFEQLSLQLPLVNRCGPACPGPPAYRNPESPAAGGGPASQGAVAADPRWAALAQLIPPAGEPAPPPPP